MSQSTTATQPASGAATVVKDAVTWFEIPARDLDRAQRFYEAVLGVPLAREAMGDEQMAIFPHDRERGISGCVNVSADKVQPAAAGTRVYLNAAPSIDAALSRVEAAGGRVHKPKVALPPGMGFYAHVMDTEGNVVGLHAPA